MSSMTILEKNLVSLLLIPGMGNKKSIRLVEKYMNEMKSDELDFQKIKQLLLQEKLVTDVLISKEAFIKQLEAVLLYIESNALSLVHIFDPAYPIGLKNSSNPPIILFYKGNLEYQYDTSLAIVGTRKYSSYGRSSCEHIISSLAPYSPSIISGLAFGIDSLAHSKALEYKLNCIGVVGHGLAHVYPKSNAYLFEKIISQGGAIVSQYLPFQVPRPELFPQRNHTVVGLSRGIVIIEAALKSGSLITAKLGLQENREVYAIPNDITKIAYTGCNYLISQSIARLLYTPDQIIDDLGWKKDFEDTVLSTTKLTSSNPDHQKILDTLVLGPCVFDELYNTCCLGMSSLHATLLEMELEGNIVCENGFWQIKNRA